MMAMMWCLIGVIVILVVFAVVVKINEIDKRDILYGGRQFEVYLSSEFKGHMCSVSIWEVIHPNRKIFRCKYKDAISFWIDDYETIKEGIYECIEKCLQDEEKESQIVEKWKALDNNNHK